MPPEGRARALGQLDVQLPTTGFEITPIVGFVTARHEREVRYFCRQRPAASMKYWPSGSRSMI